MSFDDVANRMKDRGRATRAEQLHELWHGESAPLPPLPAPVPPARRTAAIVGAYAALYVGLLVAVAAGVVAVAFFTDLSRWEFRGLVFAFGIGGTLVVKATKMFEAVANTAELPRARIRN